MEVGQQGQPARASTRRMTIGANVLVAIILFAAVVAFCQWFAFAYARRVDMTSAGVNSLSNATASLLDRLDRNVRLTSIYFEADLEDKDQPRYREAAEDLISLYESTNRTKISAQWINPLKEQHKFQALVDRLRRIPKFQEEIAAYEERVGHYRDDLDEKIRTAVQNELALIAGATAGGMDERAKADPLAQIEVTLRQLELQLQARREKVDGLVTLAIPEYAAALTEIKGVYNQVGDLFKRIGKFGEEVIARNAGLASEQVDYLRGANRRLVSVVADIESETTKAQEVESLSIDKLLDQMLPQSNALLVETDEDATVVDFPAVWPPVDQSAPRAPFERRAFKGEEKLTSAILRVTHREQTAVVFVRYGGMPLLTGGLMPGQPPTAYAAMRRQLEDANFIVKEWDLKTQETPPEIDPVPTRTLFVVLRPESEQSPFQQQQAQPFSDAHRRKILDLIGDDGRALFLAGWAPMFGSFPAAYEYGEYLNEAWGIQVQHDRLLLQAISRVPGEYFVEREFYNIDELSLGDHDIVAGPRARQLVLPFCAPLAFAEKTPEGVEYHTLVTAPARDGLWGIKSLEKYRQQFEARDFLTKDPEDREGPFTVAVAATKGDAKIAVISARDFASDQVAFARELVMTPNGFSIRSRNPGNIGLFINTLHWLNDNTEFMNVGQPIDAAVLAVPSESTVKMVQALTIGVWPALALVCGGITWWVRRR